MPAIAQRSHGDQKQSIGTPVLTCPLAALLQLSLKLTGALPTLAITWPQGVLNNEDSLAVAAQVYGDVSEWQEYQVQ